MIHSKSKKSERVIAFSKVFRKSYKKIPLVSVPSSYNQIEENFVREWLQHSYICEPYAKSILSCNAAWAKTILKIAQKRQTKNFLSIKEILNLIPGTN